MSGGAACPRRSAGMSCTCAWCGVRRLGLVWGGGGGVGEGIVVQGSGGRMQGLGCRVSGAGFRLGSGRRDRSLDLMVRSPRPEVTSRDSLRATRPGRARPVSLRDISSVRDASSEVLFETLLLFLYPQGPNVFLLIGNKAPKTVIKAGVIGKTMVRNVVACTGRQ